MSDQKTIEQRVKDIIVNQLNVNEEQITPTASFLDDLGADSLDTVELIMAFEEEFKDEIKGEIPESDAEKLQTVGQVIDYIKAKLSISGVTLANGRRGFDNSGGAIFTEHSLVLDSVVVEGSTAVRGGGVGFWIQYPGQILSITNSRFLDNTATELAPPGVGSNNAAGGAVTVQDRCTDASDLPTVTPVTVTIANSEFRGNTALPVTLGGRGGAIRSFSLADFTISDTIVTENSVDAPNPPFAGRTYSGGGINMSSAKSLRIERSEISENAAFDITNADVTRSGGLHLNNDTFDRQGGGDAMAVKILNSTISGNYSSATSGAIQAFGNVAIELRNSTVSDNQAAPTRTGGIVLVTGATAPVSSANAARPTLTLVSSILADNSSTGGDLAVNLATIPTFAVNATNSLIERICQGGTCSVTAVAGSGNVLGPIDPLLGPLAYHGGTSRTHALLAGSPAINAGSNPFALATDQRGAGFPRVVGGAADMGAYESGTAVPFTNFSFLSQFGAAGNGNGQFNGPFGIAIDPTSRNIVVVDSNSHRVQIFNSAGTYLSQFGSFGTGNGQFILPAGVAIDPVSHNILVVDNNNHRVQIFNSVGTYLSQFGTPGAGNGQFNFPFGIAVHPADRSIVVVDAGNFRVQVFNSAGVYLGQFGTQGTGDGQFGGPVGPKHVAIDPGHDDIVVVDTSNNRVQRFTVTGDYLLQFGSLGGLDSQFSSPLGIAIDLTSHNIIVADTSNNRVQVFSSAGEYLSQFGGLGAAAVAIDPTTHRLVVTDTSSNVVQIFAPQ